MNPFLDLSYLNFIKDYTISKIRFSYRNHKQSLFKSKRKKDAVKSASFYLETFTLPEKKTAPPPISAMRSGVKVFTS